MSAPLALTPRDRLIITLSHRYGGVDLALIRRRCFATATGPRAAEMRVRRLVLAGYLTSSRLYPAAPIGAGKLFLLPGPAARAFLVREFDLSRDQLDRAARIVSPLYADHHLAIGSVRLSFELAAEQSGDFAVVEWLTDAELHQAPLTVADPRQPGRTLRLIPDALLTLAHPGGGRWRFALEVNRGRHDAASVTRKLRISLLAGGDPVLWVVPDRTRQTEVATWAQAEARAVGGDPTRFWVTTLEHLTEASVFHQPIWQVITYPKLLALRDVVTVSVSPALPAARPAREGSAR